MNSLPTLIILVVLCHFGIAFAMPQVQLQPLKPGLNNIYVGKIRGIGLRDDIHIKVFISNEGAQNYVNWYDAKTYCITEGYNFAYLTSHQINQIVTAAIVNNGPVGETYWTSGIEDQYNNDYYYWDTTNQQRPFVYKNWGPNQPQSSFRRSCVVMDSTSSVPNNGFTWLTEDCMTQKRFICISAS